MADDDDEEEEEEEVEEEEVEEEEEREEGGWKEEEEEEEEEDEAEEGRGARGRTIPPAHPAATSASRCGRGTGVVGGISRATMTRAREGRV